MTRLRRRIAERLVQSQQEAAILSTFNEIDMTAVMALRKEYKDRFLPFARRSPRRLNAEVRGEHRKSYQQSQTDLYRSKDVPFHQNFLSLKNVRIK